MFEVLSLLAAAIGAGIWWNSMKVRSLASQAGRRACTASGLQFLDDTVHLGRVWLMKQGHRGTPFNLSVCRLYLFEYTDTGAQRALGRVVMLGDQVFEVELDAFRP